MRLDAVHALDREERFGPLLRDRVERTEAAEHERLDRGHVEPGDHLGQAVHLVAHRVLLALGLFLGKDVDVPPREARGEADVLSTLADRERQLVLGDDGPRAPGVAIELDRGDLRGRERLPDEYLGRFVPRDDVDALAGELVHYVPDARAANADAGALRVDACVVRRDRDLRAEAGLADDVLDLDDPVGDLGDLEREELLHEVRVRPREDDDDLLALLLDVQDVGADAVARAVVLVEDLLLPGEHTLGAAEVHDDAAALEPLHGPRDERLELRLVVVVDDVALGLADALGHDLVGRARRDPAEAVERQRLALFLGGDVPRHAVDRHLHVALGLEPLLGGGGERLLDGREERLLVHPLVAVDRVDESEQFLAHGILLHDRSLHVPNPNK